MSTKSKAALTAALILVAMGTGALWRRWSLRTVPPCATEQITAQGSGTRVSDKTSAFTNHERAAAATQVPVSKTIEARRDADFWPQQPHTVELRRRMVLPSRELSDAAISDTAPHVWLAQFGGPLSDDDASLLLKKHHIEMLMPSAAMCFYVRARAAELVAFAGTDPSPLTPLAQGERGTLPTLLGWVRLDSVDKFLDAGDQHPSPLIPLPRGERGTTRWRVELHRGGSVQRVAERMTALDGTVFARGTNWLEIECAPSAALALAELDDVYVLEAARPKFALHDAQAEANSNATPLFSAPYNLTGAGVTVMVRDEARIFAHPDFGSRLLFGPDVAGTAPTTHPTHIAGIIGGDGSSIPGIGARGFAPGCTIVSYDLNGDQAAETLHAFQSFGAVLSNHSYGFVTGWDDASGTFTDNQSTFGMYGTFAQSWDNLVRTQNLILVKSVGNSRDGFGPGHPHNGTQAADGDYYNTVDQSGTSKNVLIVGAVNDSAMASTPSTAVMVLPFSSSGPTLDGRLRPEIVANGETLLSCDNTPVTGNTYVSLTGTSQAAAAVTGATALFLQRFQQKAGAGTFCAPHYLRAVYAQTATDFGRPGPDFLHGFGMLNSSAAIALLDADGGNGSRIVSSSVSASKPERFFLFTSDGTTPIRGTLCWSDDPGDVLAAHTLVNDLDLRLTKASDQSVTFPYTLNPAVPDQVAGTGINTVDTIEQVVLATPSAGNYLLVVRGTTLASTTPFALASSHALTEVAAPVPSISTSGNSGNPPFLVNFDGSQTTAAAGASIAQYLWSFGDGTSAQGAMVQHVYLAGVFQATLKVIDSNGASASASVTIAVANKPPVAILAASPSSGTAPLATFFSSDGSNDPDGTIVSYGIDFGDGTTGTGASETHTYASPGLYSAVLTVTDNGGAMGLSAVSIYAGQAFVPSTARFGLKFILPGRDTFSMTARKLPVPSNTDTTGLHGTLNVGNAAYFFILTSKGVYASPVLNVKFTPLHGLISIRLAQTNLLGALSRSGVANTTVKGQRVLIPIAVTFENGMSFGSVGLPFNYSATQGKVGNGVMLKK